MSFFKREEAQASTSKYIQANKANADGTFKANSSALKGTPADKILTPQLKSEVQSVVSLATNPLAALLGFAASLLPSKKEQKIEEPAPTDDKAEYGKVQVKENKAGFVVINDETPGNVRQVNMHPTGTYNAMLDNGDYNIKTTNDRQEITDGNWNITTSKDKIEIVVGNEKIEIRKDITTNIAGKSDYNLEGVQNNVVHGDVNDDFKANYTGKVASNYTESVGGNKKETTSGNVEEKISGDHKETIGGALTIHVAGNINIISSGSCNVLSSGNLNIKSSGQCTVGGAMVTVKGDAMVKITAPMISLG